MSLRIRVATAVAISLLMLASLGAASVVEAKKTIGRYIVYLGDIDGVERDTFTPGDIVNLWLEGDYTERLTVRAVVVDPNGNAVADISNTVELTGAGKHLLLQWQIPSSAPTGKYLMNIELTSDRGYSARDSLYFSVSLPSRGVAAPVEEERGGFNILLIGGIAAAAIVAIVGAVYILMRPGKRSGVEVIEMPTAGAQPAQPQGAVPGAEAGAAGQPLPLPPPPPVPPGAMQSGETTVISPSVPSPPTPTAAGGGATMVVLARFVTPDGKAIPITQMRQRFGREDFTGIVPSSLLNMISRRSKPQFEVFLDTRAKQWFIVDNNSANGTFVNGEDIRGKGPVPLKSGDVVSPAGVINLRFEEY